MSVAAAVSRLVAGLDYPMVVVTVAAGDERHGCLVGFWTQCSIDPARFLVCISKNNATYGTAREAAFMGVHVLTVADRAIAELFGGETGDEADKFAACEWDPGPHDVPVLRAGAGHFVGRVLERSDAGDHVAFLVEPIEAVVRGAGRQLGFQDSNEIEPGHEA